MFIRSRHRRLRQRAIRFAMLALAAIVLLTPRLDPAGLPDLSLSIALAGAVHGQG